jgi:hypothetical protein
MAVVPFVFANSIGPIPLSELDANFANVKAFAETAGNVTGNIQANITQVGTLTLLNVSGNAVASGFVGNLIGNVTGNVVGNVTGNVVGNLTGNVIGNLTGNVIGNLTGNVIGNISGNITVSGANTQVLFNDNGVANASAGLTFNKTNNLLTVDGNILSNGAISSAGNIISNAAVIADLLLSTSGNIGVPVGVTTANLFNGRANTINFGGVASNIFIANVNSTTSIAGNLTVAGSTSVTANIIGGNILTGGNISLSGNLIAFGNTTLSGNATAATAANGTNTTQLATTAFVTNTVTNRVPTGVITLWFGSIVTIPAGWALCDGGNGTPDLRNRFVVGAGSTYAVNAVGGSANAIVVDHTHSATSVVSDPGHNHNDGNFNRLLQVTGTQTATTLDSSVGEPNLTSSGNIQANTTGITVTTTIANTGVSALNANLPPYYALAYIMKL